MRKFIIAATLASLAVPMAAAQAQQSRSSQDYRADRADAREDIRDARQDARRDARQDQRQRQRELDRRNFARYDYNRPDPRYGNYRAERYYVEGSQYRERQLAANERVYRGQDNRYYCRRNDGTTGLIVGGLGGGLIGNTIAPGGSKVLGTILGGGAGALLGRVLDQNGGNNNNNRGRITCR